MAPVRASSSAGFRRQAGERRTPVGGSLRAALLMRMQGSAVRNEVIGKLQRSASRRSNPMTLKTVEPLARIWSCRTPLGIFRSESSRPVRHRRD